MSKVGRKGEYEKWLTEDNLIRLQDWARAGLTDNQISQKMGISKTTFYDWKNKFPEFADTLKRTKDIVDAEVESALNKKCLGFTVLVKRNIKVKEIEYNQTTGKKIKETEKIVQVFDEQYIPPDTTAEIFWLKNRRPNDWREKQVIESDYEFVLANTQALAELVNKPNKDRKIEDFE